MGDSWFWITSAGGTHPPEWGEVHTAWLTRLDLVPAVLRVLELDTGREVFTAQAAARTRLADFDGRYLVMAPRDFIDEHFWVDVRDVPWVVLDSSGWTNRGWSRAPSRSSPDRPRVGAATQVRTGAPSVRRAASTTTR